MLHNLTCNARRKVDHSLITSYRHSNKSTRTKTWIKISPLSGIFMSPHERNSQKLQMVQFHFRPERATNGRELEFGGFECTPGNIGVVYSGTGSFLSKKGWDFILYLPVSHVQVTQNMPTFGSPFPTILTPLLCMLTYIRFAHPQHASSAHWITLFTSM